MMLPREGGRLARCMPGVGGKGAEGGWEKSTVVVQLVKILGWQIGERWAVALRVTEIGRIGELEGTGAGTVLVGRRVVCVSV